MSGQESISSDNPQQSYVPVAMQSTPNDPFSAVETASGVGLVGAELAPTHNPAEVAAWREGNISPGDRAADLDELEAVKPGSKGDLPPDVASAASQVIHDAEGVLAAVGLGRPKDVQVSVAEGSRKVASAEFVETVLNKNVEHKDARGLIRPAFNIAGRTVVFKNKMEKVELPNRGVTIVAAHTVRPVHFTMQTVKNNKAMIERGDQPNEIEIELAQNEQQLDSNISELDAYNGAHDEKQDVAENTLVVTNTPLGIIEAAVHLGNSDLVELRDKMRLKQYDDPACKEAVDSILAAISMSEEGMRYEKYDTDGFALALAAFTGNEQAADYVAQKRDALLRVEASRKRNIEAKSREYLERLEANGVEPLPIEKMYIVHSTGHAIVRDPEGNPLLRSTGYWGEEVPRASLHFTVNSNVYPHAQAADAWGATNKIIIAPLAATMESNKIKPEVIDGVDTWFVLDPAEALSLPDATIVEPITASESGWEIMLREGDTIKVVIKDSYSPEEQAYIRQLVAQTGATDCLEYGEFGARSFREAVVQMVLSEHGVARSERDDPSPHGHGMANEKLAQRVHATAYSLGVQSGTHFNHPEAELEKEGFSRLREAFKMNKKTRMVPSDGRFSEEYSQLGSASLSALRQLLVTGCVSAIPPTIVKQEQPFFL
jgi:hypothetical protein